METRPVSRCIAIAAHGRRCQQSPFRGSPYCWHHTQSRKVWPPSRPSSSAGRPGALDDAAHRDARDAVARAQADETHLRENGRAAAARLVDSLSAADLEILVAFLESGTDGSLALRRVGGHVVADVQAQRDAQRATA